MRSATRVLLAAFALVWGGPAAAQNDVTFQVDLNPYITTCQFSPQLNGVNVPGSMNDWNNQAFSLTDNGSGVFTGTFSLPEGTIEFKYFVTGSTVLSWENDPNRDYTVTAGAQTITLSAFNGPAPTDACSATNVDYDLIFEVDMSIQQGRGAFRPDLGHTVAVVGELNGWNTGEPLVLTEDSFTPGLYTGIFERTLLAPSATGFKFITRNAANEVLAWDSVNPAVTPDNSGGGDANRIIRLTGLEPDADGNGRRDFRYDNDTDPTTPVYFQDVGSEAFITGDATVTYVVDMRPARYLLTDTGALPGGLTAFNRVAINGPAAGESQEDGGPAGGLGDWAGWGDVLDNAAARQLALVSGTDDVWSLTLTYAAGARRDMVAKFGVNGGDNESGFAGDHRFTITEGAQTLNFNFGCIRQADGTFTAVTAGGGFQSYQPYLLVDNTVTPPTCTVVRSGGGVGAEGGPQIAGLEISGAYPNPSTGVSRIALSLDAATDVAVRVYDVTGRQVAVAADGFRAAGASTIDIDTRGFAAGLYVVRVEANGSVVSRRLTVAR